MNPTATSPAAALAPSFLTAPMASIEDLGRVFNTALLASEAPPERDWTGEIQRLMETQAFASLMGAVRHLARARGLSEAVAAEEMVATLRSLERLWREYVYQEGLERIRGAAPTP